MEINPDHNPYAAPLNAKAEAAAPAGARFLSPGLLLAPVVTFALCLMLRNATDHLSWVAYGLWLPALLAPVALVYGIFTLIRRKRRGTLTDAAAFGIGMTVFLNFVMTGMGALLALIASTDFHRGRQLRRGTRVLLPRVVPGDAFCGVSFQALAVDCDRSALANQWRENGRTEHASVAAFAKHALSLIALGAPPRLIADAQRDALDEIRHTELCFSLARALDGVSSGPGPFLEAQAPDVLHSSRTISLGQLAVHSLIDGALHEGVSARIIARLARRAQIPAISHVLAEIAADEGRHAAHAWDVVEWCAEQGGPPVMRALNGALVTLPQSMSTQLPPEAADGAWERFGIHGSALERAEYAKTRKDLARRLAALEARQLLAA